MVKNKKPKIKLKPKRKVFRFELKSVLDILTRYSVLPNTVIANSNNNNDRFYGIVSFDKREIYLQKGLSTKMKISALIHEIVHILKFENGIDDKELDTCADEHAIYKKIFGEEPRLHE